MVRRQLKKCFKTLQGLWTVLRVRNNVEIFKPNLGRFPLADSCMALISEDNIRVIQKLAEMCCLVSLEKSPVNIVHISKMKGALICIF